MSSARQSVSIESSPTWILVANRGGARLFGSTDGVKDFRMIKEFPHPEGRLKNREIESDRPGTSKAEGAANFPMHGMSNKDHAIIGEMQRFTRVLCNELETGRKQGDFSRLILVAEPRLLGRSKINLELRRMRKGRHFFLQSLDSSLHLKPI